MDTSLRDRLLYAMEVRKKQFGNSEFRRVGIVGAAFNKCGKSAYVPDEIDDEAYVHSLRLVAGETSADYIHVPNKVCITICAVSNTSI